MIDDEKRKLVEPQKEERKETKNRTRKKKSKAKVIIAIQSFNDNL